MGGTNIKKDERALEGKVDILVATPGRLLDHLQQGVSRRYVYMFFIYILLFLYFDHCVYMGMYVCIHVSEWYRKN